MNHSGHHPSTGLVIRTLKDGYWDRTEVIELPEGERRVRKRTKGAAFGPWGVESLRREIRYLATLPKQTAAVFPPVLAAWEDESGGAPDVGYEMPFYADHIDAGELARCGTLAQDEIDGFQDALAVVLFFTTFRLAYEAGGMAVTGVFDVALATVGNSAIRQDLASARPILERGGAIEEAFNEPTILSATIKSSIATGALSGRLDSSLDRIVESETVDLEVALDKFNRIYLRLVGYSVAMSIASTLLLCLFY